MKFALILMIGSIACGAVADIAYVVGNANFESPVTADYVWLEDDGAPWAGENGMGSWSRIYDVASPDRQGSDYVHTAHNGAQAMQSGKQYHSYQKLNDTYVEGRTYTFSVWAAQGTYDVGRLYIYLADGTNLMGQDAWDSSYIKKYTQIDMAAGAAWTKYSVSYTATAADVGQKIGINIYASWYGSCVDDVSVTSDGELTPHARVQFRDPHTAEVMWETDTASDSIVEYGTTEALGLRQENAATGTVHSVVLSNLQWRTKYYYRIGHSGAAFSPIYWFDNAINFSGMDASGVISPWPPDGQTAAYTNAARHILETTGIRKGYALVYGIGDGRLLFELARQSGLSVIGVDTDASRVAAARAKLVEAGIYGHRVKVRLEDDLAVLPFSKNFFNLVVSGRAVSDGTLVGTAAEARRVVRPSGGRIFMGAPSGISTGAIQDWFASGGISITPVADGNGTWGDHARGALPNVGWWSHQYGTAANNGYAGESLGGAAATSDLQLQWIGRPGSDSGLDRSPRMPAPVSSNGRLYHQGYNRIMAMDSYNGAMLWSLEIPALRRVNIPRDSGNMCADEDGLFLAVKNECWNLDGDTGDLLRRYRVDESGQEWGAVFRYKDLLIGSVVPKGSHYLEFLGSVYWYNDKTGPRTDKVCSKSVFALDPETGSSIWGYTNGIVIDTTLCMGSNRVYFVECRNPAVVAGGGGRIGASLWQDLYLVALDADTGAVLWDKSVSPAVGTVVTYLMYAPNDDRLVFLTSGTDYRMYTYNAADGTTGWTAVETWYPNNHSGFMLRPVVVDDKVFMIPRLFNLSDGTVLKSDLGTDRNGCAAYSASSGAIIYRANPSGRMSFQDLDTGSVSGWSHLRSSCWLNFTPSGGLFLMPEGGGGCSCNGWINTSVGFAGKE